MKGIILKKDVPAALRDRLRMYRELLISELKFYESYLEARNRFEQSQTRIADYRTQIAEIEARLNAAPRQRKIAALKRQLALLEGTGGGKKR